MKIQIESKLEFKPYLKLMYQLSYRKWSMIFTLVMGLLMLLIAIGKVTGYNGIDEEVPIFELSFSSFILIGLPFLIYYQSKRNFISNGRLQERISYGFDKEKIEIKGETFSSSVTWEKTYKVKELNAWMLIYQNRQVANIIPKESFSEQELIDFKTIICSLPELKRKFIKM